MGGGITSRIVGVAPNGANDSGATKKKKPRRFNSAEIKIMEEHLPSFIFLEKSTEAHRQMVATHWDKVFKDPPAAKTGGVRNQHIDKEASCKITELYDIFFAYLEDHAPHLKHVFRSSMHVRGKVLVHISAGLRTLMVGDRFLDKIMGLTKTHRRFGVKIEYYDPLGQALIHALRGTSKDDWNPQVEDAWRRLFSNTAIVLIMDQRKGDAALAKAAAKAAKLKASQDKARAAAEIKQANTSQPTHNLRGVMPSSHDIPVIKPSLYKRISALSTTVQTERSSTKVSTRQH